MITNLPKCEDFEKVSKQCLVQSLNLLFDIYNNHTEFDSEDVDVEVSINDVWDYNIGTMRTSIILLYQGIETYMKGIVCKTSPFLLLEQKRSDWPTLPNSIHKDFDSLFTISGDHLLNTYCAVADLQPTVQLIDLIEDIRRKRNMAIHGVTTLPVSIKELISNILNTYTYLFGIDKWLEDVKKYKYESPLFGYFSWDFESLMLFKYLDFVESIIGINQLKKHLSFDISSRRYFCPTCKYEIEDKYENLQSKWAFLIPNTPDSKVIYCINCKHESDVERKECISADCPGNVIDHNGICLTCYKN